MHSSNVGLAHFSDCASHLREHQWCQPQKMKWRMQRQEDLVRTEGAGARQHSQVKQAQDTPH